MTCKEKFKIMYRFFRSLKVEKVCIYYSNKYETLCLAGGLTPEEGIALPLYNKARKVFFHPVDELKLKEICHERV